MAKTWNDGLFGYPSAKPYSAAERYADIPIGGEHPKNPGFFRAEPPEGCEEMVYWKCAEEARKETEKTIARRHNYYGVGGFIRCSSI